MESRNEIFIDKDNLCNAITAFKNKLSTALEDPLASILELHKDGIKPLTDVIVPIPKLVMNSI